MELFKIFIILLLGFIDGIIFYPSLYNEIYLMLFVHILIYILLKMLAKNLSLEFYGIPNYLALFIPGIGAFIISILYFSLYYFQRDGMVLGDYERYLEFERIFDDQKKLDYDKEIGTLSFNDQMRLLDATRKKDLIVDYSINLYGGVNLLQKGVIDEDNEVRHYSAVTINMLENKYTNSINELREEYNTNHEIEPLIKLSSVYKEYLESGLVSKEMYNVMNKEYIEILLKIIERKKETAELLDNLVKAYIRSNNLIRAEEFNEVLINKYSDRYEGLLNRVEIAYEKKAYQEIVQMISDIRIDEYKNADKLRNKLSFWLINEGIV